MENGKPLADARIETLAAADLIDWFAEEGRRTYGRIVPSRADGIQQFVFKEPVGPVAAFTPWNFPINQVVRKLSGDLAAGCSIIIKTPEETPRVSGSTGAGVYRCRGGLWRRQFGLWRAVRDFGIPDSASVDPQDHFHRLDSGG